MHRNTFLLVSLLAVLAALVLGVNIGKRFPQQSLSESRSNERTKLTSSPSPASTVALTDYISRDCGISFRYPLDMKVLEATRSAIFSDPTNATASVVLACQRDIPRPPLVPEPIETLILLSDPPGTTISAKLYHDASPKDGTPMDELIFTHPKTGLDVFLAGFGDTFQQIIESVKILR